jgi:hypothetical protein
VEVEEGVVRVWREWLRDMALKKNDAISDVTGEVVAGNEKGKEAVKELKDASRELNDESILWINPARNSGLRFTIRERKLGANMPILISAEEDLPVSYEIEYDGTHAYFLQYLSLLTQI